MQTGVDCSFILKQLIKGLVFHLYIWKIEFYWYQSFYFSCFNHRLVPRAEITQNVG